MTIVPGASITSNKQAHLVWVFVVVQKTSPRGSGEPKFIQRLIQQRFRSWQTRSVRWAPGSGGARAIAIQALAPSITLTKWVTPLRVRLRASRVAWQRCSSLRGTTTRAVAPCQTTRQTHTRTRSTEDSRFNNLSCPLITFPGAHIDACCLALPPAVVCSVRRTTVVGLGSFLLDFGFSGAHSTNASGGNCSPLFKQGIG